MKTAYQTALDEFKDASAQVRRAFSALTEAREAQIIADRNHNAASDVYAIATVRLADADVALQTVHPETQAPADIDVTRAGNGFTSVSDGAGGVNLADLKNGLASAAESM